MSKSSREEVEGYYCFFLSDYPTGILREITHQLEDLCPECGNQEALEKHPYRQIGKVTCTECGHPWKLCDAYYQESRRQIRSGHKNINFELEDLDWEKTEIKTKKEGSGDEE